LLAESFRLVNARLDRVARESQKFCIDRPAEMGTEIQIAEHRHLSRHNGARIFVIGIAANEPRERILSACGACLGPTPAQRLKTRLKMDPKRHCEARSFRFDFGTAHYPRNVEGLLFVRIMRYGTHTRPNTAPKIKLGST
jgi:hypothetical protein